MAHKHTEARDNRLKQWAELRDGGLGKVDSQREMGIGDVNARRYERWYRQQRGLPPPKRPLPGEFGNYAGSADASPWRP